MDVIQAWRRLRHAMRSDDPRASGDAERLAAIAVVCAALPFFALLLHAMATTSLWLDEIVSVLYFSSQGPLRAATFYPSPNNHVLFNVLNGCFPWRGTMAPLAVRAFSFASTLCVVPVMFRFLCRRTGVFVAAAAVFGFMTSEQLLDLMLQARGYGLAGFFALVLSILAIEAVESSSRWTLPTLAMVAILGVWTLPTFACFGAPLLLFVFAVRRDWPSFLAGVGAFAGVTLVYAPIAFEVVDVSRTYGMAWGRQYASIFAIGETLRIYLFRENWLFSKGLCLAILGLLVALVMLPGLGRGERNDTKGVRLVLTSVLAFFAGCLALETPLIRATAFISLPLLLVASLVAGRAFARVHARAAVALGIAVLSIGYGAMMVSRFEFLPIQSWLSMGTLIGDSMPTGQQVWVSHSPDVMKGHLPRGVDQVTRFDPGRFREGRLVVADTPLWETDPRAELRSDLPEHVVFRFPQRMLDYHALLVAPLARPSLASVRDGSGQNRGVRLVDRNLATAEATDETRRLFIGFVPGRRYRSLVLVRQGESRESGIDVEFTAAGRDGISPGPIYHSGEVTIVNLKDLPVELVELAPSVDGRRLPRLREIWAYPTTFEP